MSKELTEFRKHLMDVPHEQIIDFICKLDGDINDEKFSQELLLMVMASTLARKTNAQFVLSLLGRIEEHVRMIEE
jgi:hypothetical protein